MPCTFIIIIAKTDLTSRLVCELFLSLSYDVIDIRYYK